MKKKILMLSLVVMVISLVTYGTLAYFTTEDTATNVITSGNVKIELHEKTTDDKDFPKEGIAGIVPGTVIDKKVTIENIGDNPVYLRVSVDKLVVEGNPLTALDLEKIILNINEEAWTLADGYYYYKTPLEKDVASAPLFTTVTFDKTIGNKYANTKFDIVVNAQAVQSKNNGDDVLKASGWPVSEVQ